MAGKVAILTDIHGNAPALEAVLDDIHRRGEIDHIYCLGDMVSIGPDVNEVLAMLCALPNLSMLTGNHEQYVLALAQGRNPGLTGEELEHQQWIAARLAPRFIPVLANLPWSLVVHHAGRRLLLQHYHLIDGNRFAPIDREPSLEKLEALYSESEADVVCFGHHHPVHLFRSKRRVYVNPGSLGCCDRPVARYGILDLSGDGVAVDLREVPYDNRAFLASYERLQVPAREIILKVFHGNQHRGPR